MKHDELNIENAKKGIEAIEKGLSARDIGINVNQICVAALKYYIENEKLWDNPLRDKFKWEGEPIPRHELFN